MANNMHWIARHQRPLVVGLLVSFVLLTGSVILFSFFVHRSAQAGTRFTYVPVDTQGPTNLWMKSVGDIDGDGDPDLVAGGHDGGGLVWYENPSWAKHTIDAESPMSTDAEVGDVDKDGDNDVVALTDSQVIWYENTGNPTWQAHPIADEVLHDVEIADLDKDGDLDVVARNQGEFGASGETLYFYRQNTPTDWSEHTLPIPNGEGLHLADLDQDGDQDVVINGTWYENTRDILNGPWTAHSYTTAWTHPNSFVATGDINGDGRLDIVLSPSELEGGTYRLSWFEAPADPTASEWTEHIIANSVETVLHFVGAADFDNDGTVDVATAEMQQGQDPDEVSVYRNVNGDGLTWTKEVLADTGSHSMRVLDVDDDGDMDLYGANWQSDQVELWVNQTCPATLDNWVRHVVDNDRPWQSVFITSANIDDDQLPDIVAGAWWYQNPGTPGGSWTRHDIGDPLYNMAAVYDFDGDGKPDILGTQGQGSNANSQFVWAHNLGGGSFEILHNVEDAEGDFLQGVAVDAVAPDNKLGVALSWHTAGNGIQTLAVPANPTVDTWTWRQISPTAQDEALSSGDIDRDGDIDLLLGTLWLENQGDTWVVHTLHDTEGAPYGESDPDRNRLGDINGDNRLDAIVGYEAISTDGKLAWYEQGLDATAAWTEHPIATVTGPMSLDVVDMDGDGDPDVVVGEHNLDNPENATLYVFENVDGHGEQWQQHEVYTGDEHHDGAQTVDIDGDGDLDIISVGWGNNEVLLYENQTAHCNTDNGSLSLTVLKVGSGTVQIEPTGPYTTGQVITLTAVPASGWQFTGWSGGANSSDNPKQVTLLSDMTVTATFTEQTGTTHQLFTSTVGSGDVEVDPAGPYTSGQTVTLTAVPASGWQFSGWSGGATGSNSPKQVTILADTTVTATFTAQTGPTYQLFIPSVGSGDVQVDPAGPYTSGQVVTLTAVPASGWYFVDWNGGADGSDNPMQLTLTDNTTVTATFAAQSATPLALDVTVVGDGTVEKQPDRATYDAGAVVTLTAVPMDGWEFGGWGGDVRGVENPKYLTLQADTAVTATFSEILPNTHRLIVRSVGKGIVEATPGGPYTIGQQVTLTATPDATWQFREWSGDISTTTNPVVVTLLADTTVTATFSSLAYPLYTPYLLSAAQNGIVQVSAK